MPIRPISAIEVPAKEFDKLWVRNIQITARMPGAEASAIVTLLPYNDSGEVSESDIIVLNIEDIMAKSQNQDSNIAKAMYFLLLSVDDEYKAQQQVEIPVPEEPQPEP